MGKRKIVIGVSASRSIAEISFFIESKGMLATAEKFSDNVHNFFESLADDRKSYGFCRDKKRMELGLKFVNYLKKYTIVFIENKDLLHIREFIPSKLIWW